MAGKPVKSTRMNKRYAFFIAHNSTFLATATFMISLASASALIVPIPVMTTRSLCMSHLSHRQI